MKTTPVLWDDPDRDILKDINHFSIHSSNNEQPKIYYELLPRQVREFLQKKGLYEKPNT